MNTVCFSHLQEIRYVSNGCFRSQNNVEEKCLCGTKTYGPDLFSDCLSRFFARENDVIHFSMLIEVFDEIQRL